MANVAAIDCDEESNKRLCGEYGVKGFPTLKVMVPKKDGAKGLSVEDYNGERSVKAIGEFVASRMPSFVQRLTSETIDKFMANDQSKVLLFTKKGTISSTYKALSTIFKDRALLGQVRDNQAKVLEIFDVHDFPKLVVLPAGETNPLSAKVYEGEMKLELMQTFIDSVVPVAQKDESDKKQGECPFGHGIKETTQVKDPAQVIKATSFLDFEQIDSVEAFKTLCTNTKSKSCVLAPAPLFTTLELKPKSRDFAYAEYTSQVADYFGQLGLPTQELVFLNGKKGWYMSNPATTKSQIQDFIDKVKMGEAGQKQPITLQKKDEL